MLLEIRKRDQQLNRKSSDQPYRQPLERVALNELVQIDTQQLKCDALRITSLTYEMFPEEEIFLHFYHIFVIVWIIPFQRFQHSDLYHRLSVESLFIPYDF